MSLENISKKQLFELYNLLFDTDYTHDEWLNEGLSGDEISEISVEDVKLKLE